jgi:hypothetical protein
MYRYILGNVESLKDTRAVNIYVQTNIAIAVENVKRL